MFKFFQGHNNDLDPCDGNNPFMDYKHEMYEYYVWVEICGKPNAKLVGWVYSHKCDVASNAPLSTDDMVHLSYNPIPMASTVTDILLHLTISSRKA